MTTADLDDDKLQRYFDGELSTGEAAEVRLAIEASPEDKAKLEQLGRLRELLKLGAEEMAASLPEGDLYAQIRARVGEPRGGLQLIRGQGRRRAATVIGFGSAVAIAAAALVAFLVKPSQPGGETVAHRAPAAAGEKDEKIRLSPPGSEVIEVDFGTNTGTVFAIEGSAGEPIAVIWIDDADEVVQ